MAIDYATNALLVHSGMKPPDTALYERAFDGLTAEAIHRALQKPRWSHLARGQESTWADEDGEEDWNDVAPERGRVDRHVDPDDAAGAEYRRQDFPTAIERARLRAELGREARGQLAGSQAGYASAELEAADSREVPWEHLLARFITGLRRNDFWLFPPSKKHHLARDLPGSHRRPGARASGRGDRYFGLDE
jgi:hypothetical protein